MLKPFPNAIIIERGRAYIAVRGGKLIKTLTLVEGEYVQLDNGRGHHPILCGFRPGGGNVIYGSPEQLARCCRAKLYRTRRGFDARVARLSAEQE